MIEPQTTDAASPPPPACPDPRDTRDLLQANRRIDPRRFNTWPLVEGLVARRVRRLEVAPGLRPRLPIAGTCFVDISAPALARLHGHGGRTALGSVTALPLPGSAFDLVCALDVVEHVEDDDAAWAEVSRVAAAGATVLLSVPLHPARWTAFDDFVGHKRRYAPRRLRAKLAEHGLAVEQSAAYGMQPRSSALLDVAMWWLTHRRREAMWWYNRVIMPLALRFEKKLALSPGLVDLEDVDEVLLVCRKG
jgi:SAM-dependent methyltransferase